jgi:hypothetical protein
VLGRRWLGLGGGRKAGVGHGLYIRGLNLRLR